MNLGNIFFIGKTLKELRFPKRWKYNFDLCSWYSEDYILTDLKGKFTGYLYLTDELIYKLNK